LEVIQLHAHKGAPGKLQCLCLAHIEDVRERGYVASRSHGFYINYAVRRDYSSPGCTGFTSTMSRAVSPLDFSSVGRTGSHHASGHCVSRCDYSSFGLCRLYRAYTARLGASARRAACHAARHAARRRLLRLAQARHRLLRLAQARHRLFHLRCASGCLGSSRGSSHGSSRRSSSTTPPHAGSSLTSSPQPCVWVPRHVARLVTRLVVPLVVDNSASRSLVIDYFASAARPGASARRAARHADRRVARR
jgi:hypothetical protein